LFVDWGESDVAATTITSTIMKATPATGTSTVARPFDPPAGGMFDADMLTLEAEDSFFVL
jgi:hypothetical protein